jgi:DNA-directed RNA polymerase specialized sigma24 family protein
MLKDCDGFKGRVVDKLLSRSIVNYPQYRMVRFSEYKTDQLEKEAPVEFSTETDDAFLRSGTYELNQTNIFCDRFFNQMKFQDIADKYDITIGAALSTYCSARDMSLKVVRNMDAKKLGIRGARKPNLTDHQRWFIMCEGFGLTKSEIARLEDKPETTIGYHVRKMTDKYKDIFAAA